MQLDQLDVALIAALRDNPRAGPLELSRVTQVARATVQSRLAKLEDGGRDHRLRARGRPGRRRLPGAGVRDARDRPGRARRDPARARGDPGRRRGVRDDRRRRRAGPAGGARRTTGCRRRWSSSTARPAIARTTSRGRAVGHRRAPGAAAAVVEVRAASTRAPAYRPGAGRPRGIVGEAAEAEVGQQ